MTYMASVHLLNVSPGDCTLIKHADGKLTMLDICDGNTESQKDSLQQAAHQLAAKAAGQMTAARTNPIEYLKTLDVKKVFRFILSHPDMDHMDGLKNLVESFEVINFWDSGSRKEKPSFDGGRFLEADWDCYIDIIEGDTGISSKIRQAGARFAYANQKEDGTGAGNGLYILAPDSELIKDPNTSDDINEGSYVILYQSAGGKILLPGDAHDVSWEYVLKNYRNDVQSCAFMLAPHHGRDSGRSYDFLDVVKPRLTLMGDAPAEHVDYKQWERRGLPYITSKQAGNVVLEIADGFIDVYVENEIFAKKINGSIDYRNAQGYCFLDRLEEVSSQKTANS